MHKCVYDEQKVDDWRTLNFQMKVQFPAITLPGYFWDRWPFFGR